MAQLTIVLYAALRQSIRPPDQQLRGSISHRDTEFFSTFHACDETKNTNDDNFGFHHSALSRTF